MSSFPSVFVSKCITYIRLFCVLNYRFKIFISIQVYIQSLHRFYSLLREVFCFCRRVKTLHGRTPVSSVYYFEFRKRSKSVFSNRNVNVCGSGCYDVRSVPLLLMCRRGQGERLKAFIAGSFPASTQRRPSIILHYTE